MTNLSCGRKERQPFSEADETVHDGPGTPSRGHCTRKLELDNLLLTPKPGISLAEATYIAKCCFPDFVHGCRRLSGERDANFRISNHEGRTLILKFINPAEDMATTEMQIALLEHLTASELKVGIAPRHQACHAPPRHADRLVAAALDDNGTCDWIDYWPESGQAPVRVRAYEFLEGCPDAKLASSQPAWMALGRQMADLDQNLSGFQHPAMYRRLLWDTTHAGYLYFLVEHVKNARLIEPILDFLTRFERQVAPTLARLPQQMIHNDLSPSNILVDQAGRAIIGILDFGDAVHAPRIAEIAVGASYQMNRYRDPCIALDSIVHGYESVQQLLPEERAHIHDLVLARLVQRIVITSWRADQFPENRNYIMRSAADAISLFSTLHETLYE
ncbi:MAG TPA: phosphotransferase [Salinisphaeraceae bacterium]|nr:phosphotransferase [Salinisphaeraceae bacterium]